MRAEVAAAGARRRRERSSTTSPAAWPTRGSCDVVADSRRDVRLHALARPRRPHAGLAAYDGPGGVVAAVRDELCAAGRRGAGRRRPRRADRARPGPGLRQDGRAQLGAARRARRCCRRSASRCWWARAASRSSAPCWPTPTARRGRSTTARTPTTALTVLLAQQRVWGLRVHDVRASRDALRTCARWGRAVADTAERARSHDSTSWPSPGSSASPTTASSSSRSARDRSS